jgi:hypothetical protein
VPQAIEKAQFDEADPRESEHLPLISLGWAWPGLAGFG